MLDNRPLSEQYYEAHIEWADLNSAASLDEELKGARLSQWTARAMAADPKLARTRAEDQVKASREWEQYIRQMVMLRCEANKQRARIEQIKMLHWENQGREATERVQARL